MLSAARRPSNTAVGLLVRFLLFCRPVKVPPHAHVESRALRRPRPRHWRLRRKRDDPPDRRRIGAGRRRCPATLEPIALPPPPLRPVRDRNGGFRLCRFCRAHWLLAAEPRGISTPHLSAAGDSAFHSRHFRRLAFP